MTRTPRLPWWHLISKALWWGTWVVEVWLLSYLPVTAVTLSHSHCCLCSWQGALSGPRGRPSGLLASCLGTASCAVRKVSQCSTPRWGLLLSGTERSLQYPEPQYSGASVNLWPHPRLIPVDSFIHFGHLEPSSKNRTRNGYYTQPTSCSQLQSFLSPPFKSKLLEAEEEMGCL